MRKPRTTLTAAFTIVELLIIVGIFCLLAAIALKRPWRPRVYVKRLNCISNLKQIGLAFKTWAIDTNNRFPMQVPLTNWGTMELVDQGNVWPHFLVMSNELNSPKVLFCPKENDAHRKMADVFTPTTPNPGYPQLPFTNDYSVSYFVGVDAQDSQPTMLLAGDINLQMDGRRLPHGLHNVWTNSAIGWLKPKHDGHGNVSLVDGSVRELSTTDLRAAFVATGMATNRLAIP
jgi:prepilin-type processing-associated H-X9-DG protein